jgi:soluble lytic murein transglycosylase-like protein
VDIASFMHLRALTRRAVRRLAVTIVALVLAGLALINFAVAFFGETVVFPFSPFALRAKLHALSQYAIHRPKCLIFGHDDAEAAIAAAEKRHGLPRGLFAAVVEVESHARPHRISPAGAMGMAQLVPSTARELRVRDPFDTEQGIDGGARYLAAQMRRYRDVRLAVAAYNAGPGAVQTRVPVNGETEHYVRRVLAEYAKRSPSVKQRSKRSVTREAPFGSPRPALISANDGNVLFR